MNNAARDNSRILRKRIIFLLLPHNHHYQDTYSSHFPLENNDNFITHTVLQHAVSQLAIFSRARVIPIHRSPKDVIEFRARSAAARETNSIARQKSRIPRSKPNLTPPRCTYHAYPPASSRIHSRTVHAHKDFLVRCTGQPT